jgi:hypothetical protein
MTVDLAYVSERVAVDGADGTPHERTEWQCTATHVETGIQVSAWAWGRPRAREQAVAALLEQVPDAWRAPEGQVSPGIQGRHRSEMRRRMSLREDGM